MWRVDGSVFCEVVDAGAGFLFTRPDRRPDLRATGGRGLWIVARLVDGLRIDSGQAGTVALIEIRV
jgi:hypothetical protein